MNIPWKNIVSVGQQTMLDTDLFSVSWILGRFCNYKCSYCWPYARSDTIDYHPLPVYKNAIDSIKKQSYQNNFRKFHWSFSGGEPTAYKHLPELIYHLYDPDIEYQSVHMTTNLSPGLAWWTRWADNTSFLQRRSVTASFHDEFAVESEFVDKLLMLTDKKIFSTVNQVMVPEKFDELFERMARIHAKGINITLKPQSDLTASYVVSGYTDSMIHAMQTGFPQHANGEEVYQIRLSDGNTSYYLDQAERFNAHGFNKFTNWVCNAGYQSVIIRSNEVKRAYSCHEERLGTLDNFTLFDAPKLCVTPSCVSSADSKIPKIIPIYANKH